MHTSNSSSGIRRLVAAGVFMVLAASPTIISAADSSSATRTVKFADLNLSNRTDAHALYMRILAAAQVVCSYVAFATDGDKVRCVQEVTEDAVKRINEPQLSAVYEAANRAAMPRSLVSRVR